MAITINGNGTVTGISAGGLPSAATDLSNDTSPQLGGNLASNGNEIVMADSDKIKCGVSDDLQLYHDGTSSFIDTATGHDLYIRSTQGNRLRLEPRSGENVIQVIADGAVELYHDNSKKFETDANGIHVTTNVHLPDNGVLELGTDTDMTITHSGSDFTMTNNTGNLIIGSNSGTGVGEGTVVFKSGNNNARWTIESGGNFIPASNNAFNVGSSSLRVATFYSNAALNTSDKTLKNTITTSDLGLDFINKLKPVSYKWNQYEGEIPDTRTHYGLIAQDVEEVIISSGKTLNDFGGVDKPEEGCMGLAYSQFVSPLIKAVQELSAEVETLKTKVAALEAA